MSAPASLVGPDEGWRANAGGACPVNGATRVVLRFACGQISQGERLAKHFIWTKRGWDFDIAAFQIASTEDVR
jgi:hypothetical protein